jgi:hypothetical protein
MPAFAQESGAEHLRSGRFTMRYRLRATAVKIAARRF